MNRLEISNIKILLRLGCSLCLLILFSLSMQAQGEKVIISEEIAASGTESCVKISVEGFTNIRSLLLTVNTNPIMGIATFSRATNFNLDGLAANNVTDLGGLFGLRLSWDAPNPNVGVTVPDGTVILEYCFDIIGMPGESSDIIVVEGINFTLFTKTNSVASDPDIMNGSITIPDSPLEVVQNNIMPDDCFDLDNGAIEITVSGGVAPYTFEWSNMSTDEDLVGVAAGTYTVTVSDAATQTGQVIMSFMVPDNTTLPIADVGNNDLIDCINQMITIGGSMTSTGTEFEYQWLAPPGVSFVSGQNETMAVVDQAGLYTFRVINTETGCTMENDINVIEDTLPPNVYAGDAQSLSCEEPGLILTATNDQGLSNISAEWSTDDGDFELEASSLSINALVAGTYSVTLTNGDNGCTAEDQVTVSDPTLPNITSDGDTPTLNCDNPSVDLTALTDDMSILVNWTTSNGQIDGASDMNVISVSAPGIYTAEATDPSSFCKASFDIEVIGNTEEPTVSAGEDVTFTCDEPIVSLTGMTDAANIEWTDANGNFVSNELILDVNREGVFILNVTNDFGCMRMDEVSVVADTMSPIANAGPGFEVGCISDGISLDGSGSDMGSQYSYMWSTSNGTLVSDFNTLTPSISSAGIYDLLVTNDDNGCSSLSSVEVSLQNNLPIADAGANFSTCENVGALVGNTTDIVSGVWTTTSNASIDNPTMEDISVANLSEGENLFIWTLSTDDCADYSRDTVAIIFESTPTAIADIQSIPLEESTISFNVIDNDNTSNNNGVIVDFQASDPNFMDLGDGNFSFTFSSVDINTYSFSYTVCSEVCPDLCDSTNVTVNRLEPALEPVDLDGLPNVITPNGDGLNDALIFDIMLTNPEDFPNPELVVFNRWGDVVYRQQPYDNTWQGTNQTGGELPEGTYYFINRLNLASTNILSGDVTIIRD